MPLKLFTLYLSLEIDEEGNKRVLALNEVLWHTQAYTRANIKWEFYPVTIFHISKHMPFVAGFYGHREKISRRFCSWLQTRKSFYFTDRKVKTLFWSYACNIIKETTTTKVTIMRLKITCSKYVQNEPLIIVLLCYVLLLTICCNEYKFPS